MDCSAVYRGTSLNKELLQGPDLTNYMIGLFLRFRKERVAFIGDLEQMYYQVRVPEHQRKYLRFVFWDEGNINSELVDFEMCVHVFGSISSMGCVNYALNQAADDNQAQYGVEAAETLKNKFYVDDLAKSVSSESVAINLINDTIGMCNAGGFNLTKIACISTSVLETVPVDKRMRHIRISKLMNHQRWRNHLEFNGQLKMIHYVLE